MDSKRIGNTMVTVSEWKKGDKYRIYFKANGGQACWDAVNGEWVKVSHEFGYRFKSFIKQAYNL